MYMHQTVVYLKTQVNIYSLILGDFSITLSPIHRSSEEKKLTTEPFNSVYQCKLIVPDFELHVNGIQQLSSVLIWHFCF